MKTATRTYDLVQAVSAIVQQQGQHDFPSYIAGDHVHTASLCGLSVFIEDSQIIRLKACDMEIIFDSAAHRAANDEMVVTLSGYAHYSFLKGGMIELERWYNRLTRFQSVFRFAPAILAKESRRA